MEPRSISYRATAILIKLDKKNVFSALTRYLYRMAEDEQNWQRARALTTQMFIGANPITFPLASCGIPYYSSAWPDNHPGHKKVSKP
jgi:hypothetical protein